MVATQSYRSIRRFWPGVLSFALVSARIDAAMSSTGRRKSSWVRDAVRYFSA
jgi:hypothetical protein